jgi:hypothetical protein
VILAFVVDIHQVKCVNMAWEVAKDGEADVDQEVGTAAGDEEDGDGWDWEVFSLDSRFGGGSGMQGSRMLDKITQDLRFHGEKVILKV